MQEAINREKQTKSGDQESSDKERTRGRKMPGGETKNKRQYTPNGSGRPQNQRQYAPTGSHRVLSDPRMVQFGDEMKRTRKKRRIERQIAGRWRMKNGEN